MAITHFDRLPFTQICCMYYVTYLRGLAEDGREDVALSDDVFTDGGGVAGAATVVCSFNMCSKPFRMHQAPNM